MSLAARLKEELDAYHDLGKIWLVDDLTLVCPGATRTGVEPLVLIRITGSSYQLWARCLYERDKDKENRSLGPFTNEVHTPEEIYYWMMEI